MIGVESDDVSYLDLQQVVSANTLVVHLMIRIVCIAATLILNKGEPGRQSDIMRNTSIRRVMVTYRRLDAVRGAGMSQRTRRPYLEEEDVRIGRFGVQWTEDKEGQNETAEYYRAGENIRLVGTDIRE